MVPPVVGLLKVTAVVEEPLHTVWFATALTVAIGLTNTVAVTGAPGVHPAAVGMIVNVTVIGAFVVLVNVPLIFPEPLAAIPVTVAVLFLVQLNTVPLTVPVNTIVVIGTAEQTVWDDGVAVASGVGFTRTVAVIGAPGQPLAVGVIVKVTVIGEAVRLVNAPLIFPDPLFAMPVTFTVLSLVQLNVVPLTFPVNAIVVIV
jgi:hypothetical protein